MHISTELSRTKILTQQLGEFRHKRTLQRWVKAGAAYAILASAGKFIHTLYFSLFISYRRFYLFFSDSGMCSSKVCTAQVADGSDNKVGFFDTLSNAR
jgi:hypothetical protein